MDAMNYEYLLSRIYQVARYGKPNVDADVYRELQHSEALYRQDSVNIEKDMPRISNETIDKLYSNYLAQCRKIWSILSEAIKKGNMKYFGILTKDEIKTLEDLTLESENITIIEIENLIEVAEKIYVKHKIFPV